jgi:tryptophan halogenase
MGVSETQFFRECDVAFKQGAKFAKWTTGAEDDAYYHPLMLPHGFGEVNLVPFWLRRGREKGVPFSAAVCPQENLCERGLAPKQITTPEYDGMANYAYHLDAGKFGAFLMRHCTGQLGVRHVLADVERVNLADNGDIASLDTPQAGRISGDMFIDCTGFRALLIGQALDVPFKDCGDVLFCDTALAVQVPYEDEEAPIASHTLSTAQSAGWIWDIGLPSRRGTGYVYSSRHISDADAEAEYRRYLGPQHDHLPVRKIAIRSGHREIFWKNNCAAVGLAAGFLEPLEASAIVLIELSAKLIAEQMPANRDVMDIVADRFNEVTAYRWGRIIDFLKLHYVLTKRQDSQFWIDNRDPSTIPERLQRLLKLWRHRPPGQLDEFDRLEEVFPAASYQYVLYGMGFETEADEDEARSLEREAMRYVEEAARAAERLGNQLPTNRDMIRKIREFGMQAI